MLKSFSSVFSILLALALFSSTISITMASPKNGVDTLEYLFSKKGNAPANSDNQLPYEERETEKDDELQDNFSPVCLILEPVLLIPTRDPDACCDKIQQPIDAITDLPLYLSKRALLI